MFLCFAMLGLAILVTWSRKVVLDEGFSWTHLAGLTAAGCATVTIAWILNVTGYGRPRATGTDDEAEDTIYRPARPRRTTGIAEWAASWIVMFASLALLAHQIWPDRGVTASNLGWVALGASLTLALAVASFSLTVIVIACALISYPFGALLHFFLSFMGADENIWAYWVIAFLMTLGTGLSFWAQIQSLKRRRRWADLPTIVASAGTAVLLLLVAVSVPGRESVEAAPIRPYPQASTALMPGGVTSAGAPNPETAVRQLLTAWRMDYEAGAARVATESAWRTLFDRPFDPRVALRGCDEVAETYLRCTAESPEELFVISVAKVNSTFIVDAVEASAPKA